VDALARLLAGTGGLPTSPLGWGLDKAAEKIEKEESEVFVDTFARHTYVKAVAGSTPDVPIVAHEMTSIRDPRCSMPRGKKCVHIPRHESQMVTKCRKGEACECPIVDAEIWAQMHEGIRVKGGPTAKPKSVPKVRTYLKAHQCPDCASIRECEPGCPGGKLRND
jgi:hypothetical protein